MANFIGTDYLFSAWVWPENLFSGIPRLEYLFSRAKIYFKKQENKKNKIKKKQRWRGSECWFRREAGQAFLGVFFSYFCIPPVCACVYSVYVNGAAACLNFIYLLIYTQSIIVSPKSFDWRGIWGGGSPPEIFKIILIHMCLDIMPQTEGMLAIWNIYVWNIHLNSDVHHSI